MDNMEKMALLFELLCTQYDGASALGKKTAQKMFYFFERAGLKLNLRYGIHYYGPYSAKLDDEMYELESEGYITINTNGPTHVISCGCIKVDENILSSEEMTIVEYVLKTFEHKSLMDFEALSTMDYIANSILKSKATDDEIMNKFKQIKGTKFDDSVIEDTLRELKQLHFIAA